MTNCFRTRTSVLSPERPSQEYNNHLKSKSADVFELLTKHFASLDCTKQNARKRNNQRKKRPITVVWNSPRHNSFRRRSVASYELSRELKWNLPGSKVEKIRRRQIKSLSLPNNLDYSNKAKADNFTNSNNLTNSDKSSNSDNLTNTNNWTEYISDSSALTNLDIVTHSTPNMLAVSNNPHLSHMRDRNSDNTYYGRTRDDSNLDWTTANSLERRRKRESSESNCSSDGNFVPQLHGRSRSLSSRPEPDGKPWNGPAAFYIDKNGRARQLGGTSRSNTSSPALPSHWLDNTSDNSNLPIRSKDAINNEIRNRGHHGNDVADGKNAPYSKTFPLKTHDHHDDAMTSQLIQAMRELKDIADVARVIDKVDNEEWLMVFIGELGHMLRDLVKFGEMEENPIKKSTLLDVLLDLIRFLKERSGYKEHSRQSIALREGLPDDVIQENPGKYDTIKRLKKLSEKRAQREMELEKWQRQLMNLAGTLEKCLTVLEDKKAKRAQQTSSTAPTYERIVPEVQAQINSANYSSTRSPPHSDYSSGDTPQSSPTRPSKYKHSHRRARSSSGVSTSSSDINNSSKYSGKEQNSGGNLWVKSCDVSNRSGARDDSWIKSPSSTSSSTSKGRSRLWPSYNIEFSLPSKLKDDSKTSVVTTSFNTSSFNNENPGSVLDNFISQTSHDHPIVKQLAHGQHRQNPSHRNTKSINNNTFSSRKTTANDRRDPQQSVSDMIRNYEGHRPRSQSDGSKLKRYARPQSTPPITSSSHISGFCKLPSEREEYFDLRARNKDQDKDDLSPKHVTEFVYHVPSSFQERRFPLLHRSQSVETPRYRQSLYLSSDAESDLFPLQAPESFSQPKPSVEENEVVPTQRNHSASEATDTYDRLLSSEDEAMLKSIIPKKHESAVEVHLEQSSVRPKEESPPKASPRNIRKNRDDRNKRRDSSSKRPSVTTKSANTQCDFTKPSSHDDKNSIDQIKQLKRRVEILQGGLREARSDGAEKERKISVLQARLERTKKNVMYGESEKGSLEEEIMRLKKEGREDRRDLREEVASLQLRAEEVERKLKKEKLRADKAEADVERLRKELRRSRNDLIKMREERDDMEQQIRKLNSELMQERGNNRTLQEENNRLETELADANGDIQRMREQASALKSEKDETSTSEPSEASQARDLALAEIRQSQADLTEARNAIDELTDENTKLSSENERLLSALLCEQTMASEAAACYLEQVKYLTGELNLAKECSELQAREYEKEIGRLLAEKRKLENQSSEDQNLLNQEIERNRDLLEAEIKKVERLEEENKNLRQQLQTKLPVIEEQHESVDEEVVAYYEATSLHTSRPAPKEDEERTNARTMTDQAVQFDDESYTRMRAFDFYSLEAQRNAKKLNDRGRQLEDDLRQRRKDMADWRKARR